MKKSLTFCICLLFVLFLIVPLSSVSANAALWGADGSGELAGSRTSPTSGGIDATDGWDAGGFTISWNITEDAGKWTYVYTVTGDRKDISHFILEVTDDGQPFNTFPGTDTDIDEDSPKTYPSADSGNPLMPNPIYGVKFDFGPDEPGNPVFSVDYTIVTNRAPVYGVFYAKDGTDDGDAVVAWSNALNCNEYETNDTLTLTDFIVRPNSVVPIPGAVWLLGSGLIGLVGIGRKFRS